MNARSMKRFWLVSLSLALALAGCAMGSPFYTAEPFSAQVVDDETGQPIEGANVVANWELVSGGLDGQRHMGQLEVKETVTDANGRFSFEGFTRANPSFGELRDADPRVLVFKGGYEAHTYYGAIRDPRDYPATHRQAAVDGKVLRLAKVKPMQMGPKGYERPVFHFLLTGDVRDIVADCQWQKIPRLLTAMEAERTRLLTLYPNASVGIGIERLSSWSKAECKLTIEAVKGYLR